MNQSVIAFVLYLNSVFALLLLIVSKVIRCCCQWGRS